MPVKLYHDDMPYMYMSLRRVCGDFSSLARIVGCAFVHALTKHSRHSEATITSVKLTFHASDDVELQL